MKTLRIGIPSKGRLADQVTDLLTQAGLNFRRQDRALFARVSDMPVEITFVRSDDIPVLCAEGAIDVGITGSDLVDEAEVDVITRLPLGFAKCRLCVCIPESSEATSPADFDGLHIASSFPNRTKSYFAKHNADVHLVTVNGSVEIMISLGVADAVVDVVQSGSTLAANKLRILSEIGSYEAVLI